MKIYENDEIYVRRLMPADCKTERYNAWFHDQEVCKYNSHGKMSHGINYSNPELNPDKQLVWAVVKKNHYEIGTKYNIETPPPDLHIGNVCLNINWINRNAEFTCIFGEKEYWGKGYCTQVLQWIINHGFQKLNLHKIWFGTASNNHGMNSAAKKNGMFLECTLYDELFLDGQYVNVIRWMIINE